jgi:hypothetical protein
MGCDALVHLQVYSAKKATSLGVMPDAKPSFTSSLPCEHFDRIDDDDRGSMVKINLNI